MADFIPPGEVQRRQALAEQGHGSLAGMAAAAQQIDPGDFNAWEELGKLMQIEAKYQADKMKLVADSKSQGPVSSDTAPPAGGGYEPPGIPAYGGGAPGEAHRQGWGRMLQPTAPVVGPPASAPPVPGELDMPHPPLVPGAYLGRRTAF